MVHAFLGGPRVSARVSPLAVPFGEFLVGVTRTDRSLFGQSDVSTDFTIQPGGGVDIGTPKIAARIAVGWRQVFSQGDRTNMFRLVVGVVFVLVIVNSVSLPMRLRHAVVGSALVSALIFSSCGGTGENPNPTAPTRSVDPVSLYRAYSADVETYWQNYLGSSYSPIARLQLFDRPDRADLVVSERTILLSTEPHGISRPSCHERSAATVRRLCSCRNHRPRDRASHSNHPRSGQTLYDQSGVAG